MEVRKRRVVAPVAAPETAAPVEVAPPSKKGKPAKVVDEQELAAREEEARLQAELAARQAAEVQVKQERSKRKTTKKATEAELQAAAVATAAKVEEVVPVAVSPVVSLAEGTLHKPAPKPGDKIAKPSKKPKPEAKSSPWDEKGHKKRTPIKTGEKTAVWSTPVRAPRHDKHPKHAAEPEHAFSLPTEPIVHEVAVPETITVAELAQKMSDQGRRDHQGVDEHGFDGHHQSGAGPGNRDDRG